MSGHPQSDTQHRMTACSRPFHPSCGAHGNLPVWGFTTHRTVPTLPRVMHAAAAAPPALAAPPAMYVLTAADTGGPLFPICGWDAVPPGDQMFMFLKHHY